MIRPDSLDGLGRTFEQQIRRADRRRPPKAGQAVPAITPRGPAPLSGGAEAPLV
jgi:hypothetical protein